PLAQLLPAKAVTRFPISSGPASGPQARRCVCPAVSGAAVSSAARNRQSAGLCRLGGLLWGVPQLFGDRSFLGEYHRNFVMNGIHAAAGDALQPGLVCKKFHL